MTTQTLDVLTEARPKTAKSKARDQTKSNGSQLSGTVWFAARAAAAAHEVGFAASAFLRSATLALRDLSASS